MEGNAMTQTSYDRVKLARDNGRPTGLDYIQNVFKDFLELHGDRRFADDPAIVGGHRHPLRRPRHGNRH